MLELWEKYQGACASSHWRDLGPQSEIRIEDDAIAALHGSGFGDCQNHRILGISRLFHFATILSYLSILPKRANIVSWMADAHKLLKSLHDLDMFFSYDVFRQCCIASLLEPYIANRTNPKILLIGDESLPAARHEPTYSSGLKKKAVDLDSKSEIIYCHAVDLELLEGITFHFIVNVASMQEMTPDVVASYFSFIRSHIRADGIFYCCNREEKVLPEGEILRFEDYPWDKLDQHFLDEEPSFYRWFFSFRPTDRHLKVANIPVPFGRLFDGPMRHRLTRLSRKLA
jgi:hypothetical protein